ncbi:MAG TPA: peptidase T, partial [Pirellulales bacterium]|nr:peptidase T [Pirellulales bacterium]
MINSARLLERFLRYVQVDTTAGDGSAGYPSSPGQLELGRILLGELRAIGLADADQDQFGIVMATLPANRRDKAPVIAFNAHVDTSPETTGKNVRPQVWRNYDGRDLALPGDQTKTIRVDANPELRQLVGHTLVTSDGTTLLGADDKAGLAVIMEAVAWLTENPHVEHGPVRLLFTCDEEIGHGVDYVDLKQLGATVCYTLDGSGKDEIDVETFSADLATVTVRGVNIHPSIGKGRMINAVRVAADFVSRLPRELSPEATDDRQGFLHPYLVDGGVAETRLKILLRDFDTSRLVEQGDVLHRAAAATRAAWPGCGVDVAVTPQYRNMGEGLAREPRAVAYAEEA